MQKQLFGWNIEAVAERRNSYMNQEELQEYIIQANTLMGQENYEAAIAYFEKAQALDQLNVGIYLSKGVAYANMEDYEMAKQEFEKVLKINKKEGVAYFHLGNLEMLMGNKARGIELYNNAIANGFDDAQVYFSLGLMHEEEGSEDLAIRNYSKAILKDPNRADIRIRKVRLYIKNQHYPEAIQALDELILSNPDVFEGYHLKFLTLVQQGMLKEAEEVVEEAMKLFPKDTGFALDKASLLITKKMYQEAVAYLDDIVLNMETDEELKRSIFMEKARAFAFLEDMDKTIECLEQVRENSLSKENPRLDLEAVYLLMNCYLNNEDFDKSLERAREIKKVKEESYYSLAAYYYEPFVLKMQGRNEEANKLFEESVSLYRSISLKYPDNIDSYAFRIMSLRELGKYEKALELADYLLAVKSNAAESHILRATVLEGLGRDSQAKEERAKAASLGGFIAELPVNE